MTIKQKPPRVRHEYRGTLEIRAVDETTPAAGTCGRISAIGVRYNVPDAYGTLFRPGCLAKTAAQKVSAGRVRYHADHIYKTTEHIGTVRSVEDVGDDVLITAEIFDTESGRRYLEYAKACMTTKSQTGCSIGFYSRSSEMVELDGERFLAFTEIELEEFSATPVNAVEGADLLSARHEPDATRLRLQRAALDALLQILPESESRAAFAARFRSPSAAPRSSSLSACPICGTTYTTCPNCGETTMCPKCGCGMCLCAPASTQKSKHGNADANPDSAHARDAADSDSPVATTADVASMDDRLAVVRRSFATS